MGETQDLKQKAATEEELARELELLGPPVVATEDEMPTLVLTRKHVAFFAFTALAITLFLYFVLPQLDGISETWDRIQDGNAYWLVAAFGFELLSFFGYVMLFRAVCIRGTRTTSEDDTEAQPARIDWKESYQITMAGLAATRFFAAAGAGGIALTGWALRRSGLSRRVVVIRMVTFMIVLYSVYMISLVVVGFGVYFGLFDGRKDFLVAFLFPLFALIVIVIFLAMALVPGDVERRLAESNLSGKLGRALHKAAVVPALTAKGVRAAFAMTRARDAGLLGAVGWWLFDIATLWASFQAFGEAPPIAVLILCYFVGMAANFLPLPGGIGGVDGGMIGTFILMGVPSGLAIVSVLVYRLFSFWLPTIPGVIAYLQLRKTVNRWKEREIKGSPAEQ